MSVDTTGDVSARVLAEIARVQAAIDKIKGKKVEIGIPRREFKLLVRAGFITKAGKRQAPWELIHSALDFYRSHDEPRGT